MQALFFVLAIVGAAADEQSFSTTSTLAPMANLDVAVTPRRAQEKPLRMNPINLVLRFTLEVAALGSMAWWGFEQREDPARFGLMLGIPIVAAATWGIFAVPGDPSRGGDGLVPVPGLVRLGIEVAVFGFATWALYDLGQSELAAGYGGASAIHYAVSWERLSWLVRQ